MTTADISLTWSQALERWLSPLDGAPLECDGFTRTASTLMQLQGIHHTVYVGALRVDGVGEVAPHFWIGFETGYVCDFRARMWLGQSEAVPHGVFMPLKAQRYLPSEEIVLTPLHKTVFQALTNFELGAYELFNAPLGAI